MIKEEKFWDELMMKQREKQNKRKLRTKGGSRVSSPASPDNEQCIDEVPIDIEAGQGDDTGVIGGILTI